MDKTKGDIVVEFADGFYPVNDTIEFTSADSGNDKCTIYYRAASGASPVISGGRKLKEDGRLQMMLTGFQVRLNL